MMRSGGECNFLVRVALQNVLVHTAIARVTSAIAAGCVHDQRAARFIRRRIEPQVAFRQLEYAVHRMKEVAYREVYFRHVGVQLEFRLLRTNGSCSQEDDKQQSHVVTICQPRAEAAAANRSGVDSPTCMARILTTINRCRAEPPQDRYGSLGSPGESLRVTR